MFRLFGKRAAPAPRAQHAQSGPHGLPRVAAPQLDHLIHGLRYYADLATKLRGSYQPLPSALGESYGLVIRRPVGVVAAIVPFNYPLTLMGTKIGPALTAGTPGSTSTATFQRRPSVAIVQ